MATTPNIILIPGGDVYDSDNDPGVCQAIYWKRSVPQPLGVAGGGGGGGSVRPSSGQAWPRGDKA